MAVYTILGAVLSYPHLFVAVLPPNPRPGQKARFSCMALIPHEVDIRPLELACLNMLREKWGENTEALLAAGMRHEPNGLRWPFRKDNMKQDGTKRFDDTKFKCFISPWSTDPIGKFDRYGSKTDPNGRVLPDPILEATNGKLYAGSIVNISVNPFVYDQSGNRGVNLGLVAVQNFADGERLDNRVDPQGLFQAEARPAADLAAVAAAAEQLPSAATGVKGSALNDLFS